MHVVKSTPSEILPAIYTALLNPSDKVMGHAAAAGGSFEEGSVKKVMDPSFNYDCQTVFETVPYSVHSLFRVVNHA